MTEVRGKNINGDYRKPEHIRHKFGIWRKYSLQWKLISYI